MKRKRGHKMGKKGKSKASTTADASPMFPSSPSTMDASSKSPSSPSTEENGTSPAQYQADNAPVIAPPPVPEPAPTEPEKPAVSTDVQNAKPKVYSRVRLKFKSAKVLETHQGPSEAKAPVDGGGGKPASAAPEASKEVVAEKAIVSPDGQKDAQAAELSGSDKDKVARKVASIKIKSIENHVKFFNNQPLPHDYEDEGSRPYFDEKEEVNYTDLISQEEHTSSQPNDGSEVAQHQHKEPTETSQEIEMEDYPIQKENQSFLQLCARLFPSNQSSVFRGRHSLFQQQQRQVSMKGSPLSAAITAIMKR
uniref:Uncharacterized protein n=1 Tax=Oryza barthii TaxID=65489 RepID=A0A0D3GGF8_9ORYZ